MILSRDSSSQASLQSTPSLTPGHRCLIRFLSLWPVIVLLHVLLLLISKSFHLSGTIQYVRFRVWLLSPAPGIHPYCCVHQGFVPVHCGGGSDYMDLMQCIYLFICWLASKLFCLRSLKIKLLWACEYKSWCGNMLSTPGSTAKTGMLGCVLSVHLT